ncbi:MAG TPA: UDP-N-acetylmuramate dehydrogenase [Chitinophagaceae bacterium]|nr:UDP-N-acetylmuramate dehydrogenase [Chitinophagaceae bacterium]
MFIKENLSLKPYNTFGIEVTARSFAEFSNADTLEALLNQVPNSEFFILGGGSNILFTKNYNGLVLKNEISGIEELYEDTEYVYVKVGAGENWHQLVLHCINNNWAGVENLSLIPGCVGAAPIQNIGAYGIELRDVFLSLEAFHLYEKKMLTFTMGDCGFGYRDSVFKTKFKNQFAILNVTLKLRKHPIFHTSYGAIEQELEKMNIKELSIRAISQAVINIRSAKLPDPAQIGNAGSFFKNPLVSKVKYENLKSRFPNIPGYENINGSVKLAAGWLIENCGPNETVSWKGFRRGDAGCHIKQSLVLVNYGNASGKEIYALSLEIWHSIKEKFGIELEREVNIV